MNDHPSVVLLTRTYDPALDRVSPAVPFAVSQPWPLAQHRLRVELEVSGHTERVRQLLDLVDDCLVSNWLSVAAVDLEVRCQEDILATRGCEDWFHLVVDELVGDLQLDEQVRGVQHRPGEVLFTSYIWQRWSRFLISHQG